MTFKTFIKGAYSRGYNEVFISKKGSMSGEAIGILVLLITLLLCSLLFATLQEQIGDKVESLNDANATASYNHITSTGWSSIDLFSLVPYVAVFIIILGLLMGL